jgi:hypothetical protein
VRPTLPWPQIRVFLRCRLGVYVLVGVLLQLLSLFTSKPPRGGLSALGCLVRSRYTHADATTWLGQQPRMPGWPVQGGQRQQRQAWLAGCSFVTRQLIV